MHSWCLTTSRPAHVYKRPYGSSTGVGGLFINGLPAPCLFALPGSAQHHDPVPAVSSGHSGTPIVVRDLYVRSRSCDH
ncbi:unnamed protein product [Staurois parvus]|uniref:Uncharacterized protein n=1 Tax=Staurois parvus TaxID=386267 RepID=A0ABN9H7L4_9NEOB|nr:unnamed protein product [Staurois parvus]